MTAKPPAETSPLRLIVEGLNVTLADRSDPVVADFALTLEPGKILALVGESGSGKSTASLSLLGLARPGLELSSGSVCIDGVDILSLTPRTLRDVRGRVISYVPQDPTSGLNPAMRVGAQVREALTNHSGSAGVDVDVRVEELFEGVGLPVEPRILRSYPHQLSGGQQQRVAIAMAFACRPSVVVLDEPTTGLDVTTQRVVLETVRQLTDRYGSSAIYVSHDLAVVANIADYTAVMYAGRIVEMGRTVDVFRKPAHHYTRGLLRAIPDVDHPSRLEGIPGSPPRPGAWPAGCSFASRCQAATEECRRAVPAATTVRLGHWARCVHAEQDGGSSRASVHVSNETASAPALLRAEHLRAWFGKVQVLHGVDVTVNAGECTAIVGESGSGKTTLARCIVGLNKDWTGELMLDSDNVVPDAGRRSTDQRRRIQYIFQNPYSSLNPRATVAQNLDEPLRFFSKLSRSERKVRILQALDEVALNASYADRMPGHLSGGERQRAAIARALLVDPDVLVCDEVTSALDVSVQATVIERLRKLQAERGLSMLFITHNLAVVSSIAQRVVVLSGGAVVETGSTADVLDNPKHPYTQQLIRDLPRMPAATSADETSRALLITAAAHGHGDPTRPIWP